MYEESSLKKFLTPSYKVKVKRYLTTTDFIQKYNQLGKAEEIINNYGKSLTLNDENIVFRYSTLRNTKKEIEIAIKTYLEGNLVSGFLDEKNINNLIDVYGSLALFVKNSKADHINLENIRCRNGNNVDEQICNDIMKLFNYLLAEKLARSDYLIRYINALKKDIERTKR